MQSNVLFIVYYFPPMGGSGVQRPLKFVKYLSQFNWHPIVLAPETGAYHTFDSSLTEELARTDASVFRVDADTPFHRWSSFMSLLDKLPGKWQRRLRKISYGVMLPDNKKGWIEPAVKKARQLIRDYDIKIIFSTAPPYSNHCIAARLKADTQLPVIMDFRDEWLESHLIEYPTRWHKRKMARLENKTVQRADAITVLDPYMRERFASRLVNEKQKFSVLPHGYDADDFNRNGEPVLQYDPDKLNLLYSGMFIHHNQPDPLLKAVSRAKQSTPALGQDLKLHFQGGLKPRHRRLIDKLELTAQSIDYGYLSHKKAVANVQKADAVWFISNFGRNHKQVKSGKLYEYMGSGKPILGLIYEGGEEERLLNHYEASYIAPPNDEEQIITAIQQLYKDWKTGKLPDPNEAWVERFDRKQLTRKLVELFEEFTGDL